MNTQKVAITIPADLVVMIDDISKQKGLSRSKYISTVLHEKVLSEKERQIKDSYNRVFSDESIKKEQLQTAIWFDGTGNQGGQEW
jgi:metal-responsive CopG/Arc/MetJ family transcriptional regulator